ADPGDRRSRRRGLLARAFRRPADAERRRRGGAGGADGQRAGRDGAGRLMLWMVLTLMVALAAVGLTVPLVRRHEARRGAGVVEVLKAQLGEIEAQAAIGTLSAEGKTAEPPGRATPPRMLVPLALGVAGIVALAGAGLYLKLGHPQPGAT